MNLEYDDDQAALRDVVRRFLSERADSAYVRTMLDDAEGISQTVWQGLAGLGATGVLVPSAVGGSGLTMVEAGLVAEELGAAMHPGPWLSTAVLAPRALLRFGVDDREMWTGIADGTTIVAVGPLGTELPRASADGSSVVLDGGPAVLADLQAADVLLVPATCGDRSALCAVVVGELPHSPVRGVDRTHKYGRVEFAATPARLVAVADAAAVPGLSDDAIAITAADALGAAQRLLDLTVAHAKERRQFGQPIGSFQAVQQLCAEMCETVELFRGGVMRALWTADHADHHAHHRAAARLKGFAARLESVGDNAIQVLGGIGYTWEHDAHLYLRRLLAFSGTLGRTDAHLRDIGSSLVAEILSGSREMESA